MAKISVSNFKAAGIYTIEIDNTQRTIETSDSLKLLVGFSNKGPFNRPVLLERDVDRLSIFGDVDNKLENKGCYFNRMLRTSLSDGPVVALNLLNVDKSFNGPDQVNYAAMSLDAGKENPEVDVNNKYGEYDYSTPATPKNLRPVIPYVGNTPFANLYDRSRFWVADKGLLTAAAAKGLNEEKGSATYEYSNLLNFANVGTEEFSILVFKTDAMPGYEVTAETWYGGKENIPFGWIRPYDYISDYFLQVICVKGNWTNYPVLATDPVWKNYFDRNGIIKGKINKFLGAEGVVILGQWSGTIIPDFINNQGQNLNLEKLVNGATERTGLLMSFNEDAANLLTFDHSGRDLGADEAAQGQWGGQWGIDIDGNQELENSESLSNYLVDMVGHNLNNTVSYKTVVYKATALQETVVTIGGSEGQASFGISRDIIPNHQLRKGVTIKVQALGEVDENSFIIFAGDTGYTELATKAVYNELENTYNFNIDKAIKSSHRSLFIKSANNQAIQLWNVEVQMPETEIDENGGKIKFLSYNYTAEEEDGVTKTINNAYYFNDTTNVFDKVAPVSTEVKNMFIITKNTDWMDEFIKVGDYVQNITFENNSGDAEKYHLIPGLTRVIKKQFIQVLNGTVTYKGKTYNIKRNCLENCTDTATNGNKGFYLITTTAPVLVKENTHTIIRQLPISSDEISHSLKFIPMKGLTLTSRHRPGYDANGNLNIEEGIEKVYAMMEDAGIARGLMNKQMVEYRYIIDSMSYGLRDSLGGKVHLSRTAKSRGKCTAILNLPSAKQFAISSNPYFCDTFIPGTEARPGLNTKYIPEGGNTEMGASNVFSLPSEEDGSKFTACFFPHLLYKENGKDIIVPPAADVANVLARKFTGVSDPYVICANTNGIINNKYVKGLEFLADDIDRSYLEPFGVNTIIEDGTQIMIYGNQTAYQEMKSDLNKLHVRENLNTLEIECEKVTKRYNFLYNTPATRAAIVQQLTPILQTMQISGALERYEIICDETNNTPYMIENDFGIVDVVVYMNHGMEKIIQSFTLNRLGAE